MPTPAHAGLAERFSRRPACEGREKLFDRSGRHGVARQALAICRDCPVLEPCRAWSLTQDLGPRVAGGMTAAQRRAARRRDHLVEPTSNPSHAHTPRQRVADAADPAERRQVLTDLLRDPALRHVGTAALAAHTDVTPAELERVRGAVLAAHRHARQDKPSPAGTPTPPDGETTAR